MLRATLFAVVLAVATLSSPFVFAADLPNLAPPRFDTEFAIKHKEDIIAALERDGDVINFAGQWTNVSWSCGDNCKESAAINRLGGGEVIPLVLPEGKAVMDFGFYAGSYLIAVNPSRPDAKYYRLDSERGAFVPVKLKGASSPERLFRLSEKYPAPFDPAWACNSTNQCE